MENACFIEQVVTEWMLFGLQELQQGLSCFHLIARTAPPWRSWRSGTKLGWPVGSCFSRWFSPNMPVLAVVRPAVLDDFCWGPIPWRSMFPRSLTFLMLFGWLFSFFSMQVFHQLSRSIGLSKLCHEVDWWFKAWQWSWRINQSLVAETCSVCISESRRLWYQQEETGRWHQGLCWGFSCQKHACGVMEFDDPASNHDPAQWSNGTIPPKLPGCIPWPAGFWHCFGSDFFEFWAEWSGKAMAPRRKAGCTCWQHEWYIQRGGLVSKLRSPRSQEVYGNDSFYWETNANDFEPLILRL